MENIIKISASESEVMEVIWRENRELTPTQIMELISCQREWKYSTLKTFLARLTQKGLLVCEPGKTNTYKARVSESDYKKFETREFIQNIHKGSLRSMVASLCRQDISDERLSELLNELEGESD